MSSRDPILPLEFDAVSFSAGGVRLLEDVSFEIGAAGRTVILGPNGAGKSLSLRLAHGLLEPTAGTVTWHGESAAQVSLRRRQAMVFERPVLLRRSAAANLEYGLALRGEGRASRKAKAAAVLERTGLLALASRPARVLSAGERQRLALARAWVLDPDVLFLDEPTAALDPTAARTVEGLIEQIAEDGCKIVMTTHDLGQARRLADDILFFCEGRLAEQSDAQSFFESPASPQAAAFLRGDLSW